MSLKVNRINRSVSFTAHLYYNKDSWNTALDSTPRYYLKPVELNYIERIAFSDNAEDKGYTWYGNGFYGGKGETTMNDAEALALFENIKNSYPFGYDNDDTSSRKLYEQDVMLNASYQSYYASYWKKNLHKVQRQTYDYDGNLEQPFPFMVLKDFKIQVRLKYNKGKVPTVADGIDLASQYQPDTDYYQPPTDFSCGPKVVNVTVPPSGTGVTHRFDFALDGSEGGPAMLNASGTEYVFRFTTPWPQESGDAVVGFSGDYLPYDFRFSNNIDGTNAQYFDARPEVNAYVSGTEYTAGTLGFIETETVTYDVRTTGNPNFGTVFYLDGSAQPNLTFKRGSEYIFNQTDVSNSGHPLYIGTDSNGGDKGTGIACDVQAFVGYTDVGNTSTAEAKTIFRVPLDAPNALYYVCRNHAGMGGVISVIDPPSASTMSDAGYIPGSGIKFKVPESVKEMGLHYYSSGTADMGQFISVNDNCVHKCEEGAWKTTGGISGDALKYS